MEGFFNMEVTDQEMVTEWFNSASITQSNAERLDFFYKIQEVLVRKSPHLLNEFLPNVLNFTTDKSADIKKALVGLIEEVCKMDETILTKVMLNLHMLLCDESIPVQKRVIQATISIYRRMLAWLCKAPNVMKDMEDAWNQLNTIKLEIVNMIDSDNDGVRTSSVKFLECVILLQSYPDPNESKPPNDFSLDDVPLTLKVARRRKLEEEANKIFALLVKFTGSQHISSANLFASIGALTNIGKHRPVFLDQVVTAIENLHSNLPPTLSTTQVNSVRKKLKSELMGLIKHPCTFEFVEIITPMLIELGCSQQEILKNMPKVDDRSKRQWKRSSESTETNIIKKPRIETETELDIQEKQLSAVELNEQFILENLSKTNVIQLVMKTLQTVPDTMPAQFKSDYSDLLKYEQSGNLNTIAKQLAYQFLEAGVGPGSKIIGKSTVLLKLPWENTKSDEKMKVGEAEETKIEKEKRKERVKVIRIKTLKLAEITKPLDKSLKEDLLLGSVKRILTSDKKGPMPLRQKIIITIASTFNDTVRENILTFLLCDLRSHLDLALAWLYEEYSIMQGFTRLPDLRRNSRLDQSYNTLLNSFVSSSSSDAIVLSRLLLEAPVVTEQVLDQLCIICRDEQRCNWSMGLLRDLIIRRPTRSSMFLTALLTHTTHESSTIRECAIGHTLDLYRRNDLKSPINEFVSKNLEFLKLSQPPEKFFGHVQGRLEGAETWNDDLAKSCLQAYVSLLPHNEILIHNLAKVYVQTNADTKRTILRMLECPIRMMGMESVELLKLVEDCPKGSETLVTRVIHILTDKGTPSPQLVQRVRDLYNTRVSDVRFLIPVLNGLTKKEVIAALPKLVKLNPVVVREVFNRLLGVHGDSCITPTELLVALHLLDQSKVDLKTIMKATSMCISEKQIFTQEVLAVVLQQLMDQPTLPTLLMRTVIQALGSYPRLSGFVMNILQRLILKQVWKHKVVWEGFVKCCQRTKPQSFTVLMQLPTSQLSEALEMCPELKTSLNEHLLTFSETQRAHIPAAVQEIILGTPVETPEQPAQPVSAVVVSDGQPIGTTIEPLPPGME